MCIESFAPFSFAAPTRWARRATIVWVGDGDDAAPPNMMVTREARRLGESVESFALRRVLELSRRADFELLASGRAKIAGHPAFRALARWSLDSTQVTQALAFVGGPNGEVLGVTCTAVNAPSAFDELERFLATIQLASSEPRVPDAPPPPSDEAPVADDPFVASVPMPGARPARR